MRVIWKIHTSSDDGIYKSTHPPLVRRVRITLYSFYPKFQIRDSLNYLISPAAGRVSDTYHTYHIIPYLPYAIFLDSWILRAIVEAEESDRQGRSLSESYFIVFMPYTRIAYPGAPWCSLAIPGASQCSLWLPGATSGAPCQIFIIVSLCDTYLWNFRMKQFSRILRYAEPLQKNLLGHHKGVLK